MIGGFKVKEPEPEKEIQKPKFEPGDRVKTRFGDSGTIVNMQNDDYEISMDDGTTDFLPGSSLRLTNKSEANERRNKQIRSKEFKNWFGDWENNPQESSKVVDKKTGEPSDNYNMNVKVVYHGSTASFDEFDPKKIGNFATVVGKGFYFAEDKAVADNFADKAGSGKGNVIASYLNIRKPFDYDADIEPSEIKKLISLLPEDLPRYKKHERDILIEIANTQKVQTKGWRIWSYLESIVDNQNVNELLYKAGYDGITHHSNDKFGSPDKSDPKINQNFGEYGRVWIAFNPNQIKSVDNEGTFDPSTNKINKGLAKTPRPLTIIKGE